MEPPYPLPPTTLKAAIWGPVKAGTKMLCIPFGNVLETTILSLHINADIYKSILPDASKESNHTCFPSPPFMQSNNDEKPKIITHALHPQ